MMRYTTGWYSPTGAPAPAAPVGAAPVIADVWEVGGGSGRATVSATAELAVTGSCYATHPELDAAARAANAGHWSAAAMLPGSYLAVVRTPTSTVVVGDLAGTTVVYYVADARGGLWWSTAATPLAAWSGTGPDLARLTAGLAVSGVDLLGEASLFAGVRRVPPGRALVLDRAGARTESLTALEPCGFEEGAWRLRTALEEAVARRCEQEPTVSGDLSGGWDSTTLVCLAASRSRLIAVTYTDGPMSASHDVAVACQVGREVPGVDHRVVDGRSFGVAHFDGLGDPAALPATDVPAAALALIALDDAQYADVKGLGGIHLTGHGGDNLLCPAPTFLADLIDAGRWPRAMAGVRLWARANRVPVAPAVAQLLRTARQDYPAATGQVAAALRGRVGPKASTAASSLASLRWCAVRPGAGWLTGDGRRQAAALLDEPGGEVPADCGRHHDGLALADVAAGHGAYAQLATARWGMDVHAPFMDNRVVAAAMAVPAAERSRPGQYKPLLRAAMAGAVPAVLAERTSKTDFTASMYVGLERNAPVLKDIVGSSVLGAAGLLDAERAAQAVDLASAGMPVPVSTLHHLVAAELWLARLDLRCDTWWTV